MPAACPSARSVRRAGVRTAAGWRCVPASRNKRRSPSGSSGRSAVGTRGLTVAARPRVIPSTWRRRVRSADHVSVPRGRATIYAASGSGRVGRSFVGLVDFEQPLYVFGWFFRSSRCRRTARSPARCNTTNSSWSGGGVLSFKSRTTGPSAFLRGNGVSFLTVLCIGQPSPSSPVMACVGTWRFYRPLSNHAL